MNFSTLLLIVFLGCVFYTMGISITLRPFSITFQNFWNGLSMGATFAVTMFAGYKDGYKGGYKKGVDDFNELLKQEELKMHQLPVDNVTDTADFKQV